MRKINLSNVQQLSTLVLVLLFVHLILWSGLPAIFYDNPDVDNVEELVWGSAFEWGYFKHPPLPGWVVYIAGAVLGRSAWLSYFAGQLSVVLALFFVWKLGTEFSFKAEHNINKFQQNRYALVAMLLLSLIVYFTVRGIMNNHNTMQLWSIAGSIWMFYRAKQYQRLSDWAWLGVFCGFAMLTKYSALIYFFCFFVYLLWTGALKQKSTWQGIAIASAVFLALIAPHLIWLSQQTVSPVGYAQNSLIKIITRHDQLITIREFLVTNLGRIAPMLVGLGILIAWNRIKSDKDNTAITSTLASTLEKSDRFFILFIGIVPIAATLLFALIFNVPLSAHWATTFFLLFGFFCWWWLSNTPNLLYRTVVIVITIQLISSLAFSIVRGPVAKAFGYPARSIYPGKEITQQLLTVWDTHNKTPLTLVAGDIWTAGVVAMHAPRKIQVLIDGDSTLSPWVNLDADMNCGMLVLVDRSPNNLATGERPQKLLNLYQMSLYRGEVTLPWTSLANGPLVKLEWGIIPAKSTCSTK